MHGWGEATTTTPRPLPGIDWIEDKAESESSSDHLNIVTVAAHRQRRKATVIFSIEH